MNQTYFVWDIDVNGKIARVMGKDAPDALEKARLLLGEAGTIKVVVEYWLPGVTHETMVKAVEKMADNFKECKKK